MATKTLPANAGERPGLPVPLGRIVATPNALRVLSTCWRRSPMVSVVAHKIGYARHSPPTDFGTFLEPW